MKQFFLTMGGVFAGLLLFFIILPFIFIMMIVGAASSSSRPTTVANSVLELDLRGGISDQASSSPFAAFSGSGLSVMKVVDTLAQAEKPVIAHSQGFQPVGAVIDSYMIGASASELWMQNTANFQVTGFASNEVFLGRAFEKYGVRAEFEQRYEYKNAVNEYTQSDFTGPHREAMTAWMTSIYTSALGNAAQDRKVTPAALRATIEAGPYSAEQALSLKLIDKIGQVEEAEAEAKRRAGSGAKIIEFGDYSSSQGEREGSGKDAIAIVGAEGDIVTGRGGGGGFGGGSSIHSDDTAKAIYDKDVKAIVFRVSSPGGSPEASEQILAAVRAARAAGKPVVVSMGSYAASGGYWISSEADWIVAQPSTLTGSIGVFGGKFVLAPALARFGVDMRGISVGGDYSDAFSPAEPFTASQRAAFSASMDKTYEEFVQRVSTGRHLPVARVREIARGRVWTGAQGKELGLVDQLGGLTEAIGKARELAKIPDNQSVRFKRYPKAESPWEALSSAFGVSSEAAHALIAIGGVMSDPQAQAVIRTVEADRMRSRGAVVMADQPLN
jgi:protease-4